jgi:hypothetical protein
MEKKQKKSIEFHRAYKLYGNSMVFYLDSLDFYIISANNQL